MLARYRLLVDYYVLRTSTRPWRVLIRGKGEQRHGHALQPLARTPRAHGGMFGAPRRRPPRVLRDGGTWPGDGRDAQICMRAQGFSPAGRGASGDRPNGEEGLGAPAAPGAAMRQSREHGYGVLPSLACRLGVGVPACTRLHTSACTPKTYSATVLTLTNASPPQDLEIIRGYVPGYNGVLGHEFVGTVVAYGPPPPAAAAGSGADTGSWPPPSTPLGTRVVGEINCNDAHYTCADAVFQRNHAPGRCVRRPCVVSRGGEGTGRVHLSCGFDGG